ncbi:MAG: polysaccharide export protein [Candidatus Omnitrophica bacterium]|nr:polysaccharide export protein [Candidatus Omnitrophota bacterium]
MFWINFLLFFFFFLHPAFSENLIEKIKITYKKANYYYQRGEYQKAEKEYLETLRLIDEYKINLKDKNQASSKKEKTTLYTIGEGDILYISVWQNEDLNQEIIVRPDGYASFPLIGDLKISGLTIPQLDKLLTEKLKEYIRRPEVSITLRKIGGSRVVLLGEVTWPGVYHVDGTKTVLELIGMAGDFTLDAVKSSVILIRGGFLNPEVRRLNIANVLKGDLTDNVVLQSEDIVFVPKTFISNLNYVINQILEPLSGGSMVYSKWHSFDRLPREKKP